MTIPSYSEGPNTLPRSLGSVKVVASNDNAEGTSGAANRPWQARAVTSIPKSTEAPPTAHTRRRSP